MSEEQMNNYRLTSMEEPGDERVAAGIEAATQAAQEKWGDTISRIKSVSK